MPTEHSGHAVEHREHHATVRKQHEPKHQAVAATAFSDASRTSTQRPAAPLACGGEIRSQWNCSIWQSSSEDARLRSCRHCKECGVRFPQGRNEKDFAGTALQSGYSM